MLPSKCQLKQFLCLMNFTCLCSHQHSSGIFVVGGGGYACSSFGAGSGHFEYFVVRLLRLVFCISVFLLFSKCISVFCYAKQHKFHWFSGEHRGRRHKDLCGHWQRRTCKMGCIRHIIEFVFLNIVDDCWLLQYHQQTGGSTIVYINYGKSNQVKYEVKFYMHL